MAADSRRSLLFVAGDGATQEDGSGPIPAAPTVSAWALPDSASLNPAGGTAWPTLMASVGRPPRGRWLLSGLAASAERYSGCSLVVSPDGRRLAVAQPGAPLSVLRCQVWSSSGLQALDEQICCPDCPVCHSSSNLREVGVSLFSASLHIDDL